MLKARFAPSPTGNLHIGGARTALFNWLYAKSQKGQFILRIEDTDRERSKKIYVDEILDSMKWLGFDWDALHFQSERFDIYQQYANQLLEAGKAYRDAGAIILKMPQKEVRIYDLIRGEIVFDTNTIKDQVLIKSDGSPTYSFACVVDDSLMEITCVIRGEDHISNTPKQIIIYEALGFAIPKFAHLPLIMGDDGRLSKRTGAVAVSEYRKMGFLPEAIVNYLMLLGWSPGNNQEMIATSSAIGKFSIKKVNKAAAIFSMEKLKWLNSQYIKQMDTKELVKRIQPFLEARGWLENYSAKDLEGLVHLYKGRLTTLEDLADWTDFIFEDNVRISDEDKQGHLTPDKKKAFDLLAERLGALSPFDAPSAETSFRGLVQELNMPSGDLVHPVRVALTGKKIGPGLFETMAVLGKEKTVRRLRTAFN